MYNYSGSQLEICLLVGARYMANCLDMIFQLANDIQSQGIVIAIYIIKKAWLICASPGSDNGAKSYRGGRRVRPCNSLLHYPILAMHISIESSLKADLGKHTGFPKRC